MEMFNLMTWYAWILIYRHRRVVLPNIILIIEYSENHGHLQSKHWIYLKPLKQQRGDDDRREVSQEHVGHVQPDGQQSMPAQEKSGKMPCHISLT